MKIPKDPYSFLLVQFTLTLPKYYSITCRSLGFKKKFRLMLLYQNFDATLPRTRT